MGYLEWVDITMDWDFGETWNGLNALCIWNKYEYLGGREWNILRKYMVPKDIHVWIPRTSYYYLTWQKQVANVIKHLELRDFSWNNLKHPYRKASGSEGREIARLLEEGAIAKEGWCSLEDQRGKGSTKFPKGTQSCQHLDFSLPVKNRKFSVPFSKYST